MSRAKSFFKKLADKLGFKVPSIDITPKREQEIIDMITKHAVQWGLEDWAILGAAWFMPMSAVVGYTVVLPWMPILQLIGFTNPYEYVAFLSNQQNIKKIMNRLEEETKRTKK